MPIIFLPYFKTSIYRNLTGCVRQSGFNVKVNCIVQSRTTIIASIPLYIVEEMLKYSQKHRQPFSETQPSAFYAAEYSKENQNGPLSPLLKPTPLAISRHSRNENQQEMDLTPRTAKKQLERTSKYGESFSKSIHVTPDKEHIKKDSSFILPKNNKDLTSSYVRTKNKPSTTLLNFNVQVDPSQQVFKNKEMNGQSRIRGMDELAKLRQTVSNASSWQLKLNPSAVSQKEKDASFVDVAPLRKKIESQYVEVKKQATQTNSKHASRQPSRKNSRAEHSFQEQPSFTDRIGATKTPPKLSRVSQDKVLSNFAQKDRLMTQTDPGGNSYQLALSRKATTQKQLTIDDFQLGACKGQGRFGKVFPAIHKKTGFLMAIKKVAKEPIRLMQDQFMQEIKISLFLNHPNVVKMYGCFADVDNIYILLEYMEEGSLYKHMKLAKKFSDEETSGKLQEICEAVRYLHSQDILHRDIKPQNIVLSNGVSKLCDFGWATYSRDRRTTYCGTLDYVCPEILEGQSYDNFVDIWAIGVLAYELLVGKAPFYHISRKETMKSILNCQFSFPVEMSVGAKLFIMKALQKNPDNRFNIDYLIKDRFLANAPKYD